MRRWCTTENENSRPGRKSFTFSTRSGYFQSSGQISWDEFADQYGSGRVGFEESQNGRMDSCGTRLRSRAMDSRFADDDGCFDSTLPRDLFGGPTNFVQDGQNLFAGFGRSRRVAHVARRNCSGHHKPKLLSPCSLVAYKARFCSSSDGRAWDCCDEKQVPGIGTGELSAQPCKDPLCGDPTCFSSDSHFNSAGRGFPYLVSWELPSGYPISFESASNAIYTFKQPRS
jgi:hypothetical protein